MMPATFLPPPALKWGGLPLKSLHAVASNLGEAFNSTGSVATTLAMAASCEAWMV
jgi:hypothetical protein